MSRKTLMLVGGCAAVFLAAIAYGMSGATGEPGAGPATVTVELGTLVEKALVTGTIVPRQEVDVKSKVSGTVAKIFVEAGDRVEAGDPLLEVSPSPTPIEYAQKKRTVEIRAVAERQRKAELTRVSELYGKGMVSRSTHEEAAEAHEKAVLNRKMAEEELAILDTGKAVVAGRSVDNVIFSPVAGHVLTRDVDQGDPVVPLTSFQPGTSLMTIADMDDLLLTGTVDEIDVGKVHEGMQVEIQVGAYPDRTVTGSVLRIALKSEIRDNATVFETKIGGLTSPDGVQLRAGYSANGQVIIRRAADVPVIPERVLRFAGNDSVLVRVLLADGGSEERAIVIGMADGINAEIVSGLSLGEVVLEKDAKEIW